MLLFQVVLISPVLLPSVAVLSLSKDCRRTVGTLRDNGAQPVRSKPQRTDCDGLDVGDLAIPR